MSGSDWTSQDRKRLGAERRLPSPYPLPNAGEGTTAGHVTIALHVRREPNGILGIARRGPGLGAMRRGRTGPGLRDQVGPRAHRDSGVARGDAGQRLPLSSGPRLLPAALRIRALSL